MQGVTRYFETTWPERIRIKKRKKKQTNKNEEFQTNQKLFVGNSKANFCC